MKYLAILIVLALIQWGGDYWQYGYYEESLQWEGEYYQYGDHEDSWQWTGEYWQ